MTEPLSAFEQATVDLYPATAVIARKLGVSIQAALLGYMTYKQAGERNPNASFPELVKDTGLHPSALQVIIDAERFTPTVTEPQ